MQKIQERFRELAIRHSFRPSWIGVIVNPVYLIRSSLWAQISPLAKHIQGRVLDFGCGSKPYRSLFPSCDEYVGVDIETSGHDHSESKVDFFWDGNRLPFPDDYFDAVVSFEVFEHIFEPHNVLRELNRVTKRGGSLLISTPFQYGEHEQPYDFARYTSFGLAYILGAGGFEVSHLVKTGSVYMVLGQIIVDVIDHVTPRVPLLGLAFKIILSAPVILASIIFTKIWPPKSEDRYFLNLVVAARKI